MYRFPHAAPAEPAPRGAAGRTIGRFCLVCASIYPLHRKRHRGKAMYGRDHIASPCAHEGDVFEAGANWWEPAVEVVPEALAAGRRGSGGGLARQGDGALGADQREEGSSSRDEHRQLPSREPPPRPGRPSPTTALSRLAEWLRRREGVRGSPCRFAAASGGVLIRGWSGGLLFPLTPAISLTAGLLFGWLGIAGTVARPVRGGLDPARQPCRRPVLPLSFALAGAAGWLVFRYRPQARARPAQPPVVPLDPGRRRSWAGSSGSVALAGLLHPACQRRGGPRRCGSGPGGPGPWSASRSSRRRSCSCSTARAGAGWCRCPASSGARPAAGSGRIPGSGEETVVVHAAAGARARSRVGATAPAGLLDGAGRGGRGLSLVWLLPRGTSGRRWSISCRSSGRPSATDCAAASWPLRGAASAIWWASRAWWPSSV